MGEGSACSISLALDSVQLPLGGPLGQSAGLTSPFWPHALAGLRLLSSPSELQFLPS